jgi:hypothetical protein
MYVALPTLLGEMTTTGCSWAIATAHSETNATSDKQSLALISPSGTIRIVLVLAKLNYSDNRYAICDMALRGIRF